MNTLVARAIAASILIVAVSSCGKTPTKPKANEAAKAQKPAPAKTPPSEANGAPATGKAAAPVGTTAAPGTTAKTGMTVGGVTFMVDSGWVAEPPKSRMRLAQFKLPRQGADTRDGELTVITAGGTVAANIARWKGQFDGEPTAKRDSIPSEQGEVAWVELEGTFLFKARPMAPGPGTPQPGTVVLGGIVKTPNGRMFFKAWGPKATMTHWRASMKAALASLSPGA